MRIVIPMTGAGVRFAKAGYKKIKPIIEIQGKPIIEHLMSAFPEEWPVTFICSEEQKQNVELQETLDGLAPKAIKVFVPSHKKGPVWAVLEAIRINPASIPGDEPCLVNYCDFAFTWDPHKFEKFVQSTKCDGAVLCYTGFHPEYLRPQLYAYCRTQGDKLLEIKEKGHFTPDRTQELASSGSYYFKSGDIVRKYFEKTMDSQYLINGEGYVSVVYSTMLKDNLDCRVSLIDYFLQFGTPADVQDFEYWAETFKNINKNKKEKFPQQLLMPMAGRGSRFETGKPKPLIDVMGTPMFVTAQHYLPQTEKQTLVVRREMVDEVQKAQPQAKLKIINEVTEGQAITCQLALPDLDPKLPVFVSSCDHGILWSCETLKEVMSTNPDVVVWGQRQYPGADCTPKAFAYIKTEPGSSKVTDVSVKQPISENPRQDLLLMGTFYFKSPQLMNELIDELKSKNIRVNNEFYLDSVVGLAVKRGLNVQAFESRGYLCWGTPTSLLEFGYWKSYFESL